MHLPVLTPLRCVLQADFVRRLVNSGTVISSLVDGRPTTIVKVRPQPTPSCSSHADRLKFSLFTVQRWAGCAGPRGRFKTGLVKKIVQAGGADKLNDRDVAPILRQTLLHCELLDVPFSFSSFREGCPDMDWCRWLILERGGRVEQRVIRGVHLLGRTTSPPVDCLFNPVRPETPTVSHALLVKLADVTRLR